MRPTVVQLDESRAVGCPCGVSRRAFADVAGAPASVHVVDISLEARPHYHRNLTEIYVVLEGTGHVEVDGERVPVKPLTAVLIPAGCRHRAVGKLRVLNVVVPPFDPKDEWEDKPR
jgi:mannose-6-phosphate isomerase-like protein (cupin superfamily)